MSAPAALEQDRDLGRLLDDTVALYRRHLGAALALAAGVVLPVELLVSGVGLGQLTGGYDHGSTGGAGAFSSLVSVLITTPLVTGMIVRLTLAGEAPGGGDGPAEGPARRAAAEGLERFGTLLAAVLLATLGILLGLIAFIVPGVVLAVRWAIVAPAVMAEGVSGADALRRSSALVAGHSWWVLGVMLVQGLIVGILGAVLGIPADALARSADSSAFTLAGAVVAQILALPFSAFATTLLFFTLRARKGAAPLGARSVAAGAPPASGAPAPGPAEADEWRPPAARTDEDGDAAPSSHGWEPPVPPR